MKKLILIPALIIALFMSACAASIPSEAAVPEGTAPPEESASPQKSELESYMTSLEESSDAIHTSLETEALTQAEMNEKSHQLYELWDDALNYLWRELKAALPEEEFSILLEEQLIWIKDKEQAVEEIGRDFQGGSMYVLVTSSEAARITEERVWEFYDILMHAD
ncbi:MAG: DUF1311 domain-containing protein [Ruminococcaceae bacterium]|nr:DUF1311 domain-containing protein [Oscillospiraceae bacterium]